MKQHSKCNKTNSHHVVGASNLVGSALGKQSLSEEAKLPELNCGWLRISLLLHRCLPQLISFVLHLGNQHSNASIHGSMEGGRKGSNLLLGCFAILLDLVDSAIQRSDCLPRFLFSLSHGDGVTSDLVLKRTCNLAQWAEIVLWMFFNAALGANGFIAGLAVGVDIESKVFPTAGYSLDSRSSDQGIFKGGDEGDASKCANSTGCRRGERCLALVAVQLKRR